MFIIIIALYAGPTTRSKACYSTAQRHGSDVIRKLWYKCQDKAAHIHGAQMYLDEYQ